MQPKHTISSGRRGFLALAGGALAMPGIVQAQPAWPARSVRIVNAYSPGGTADVVCRIVMSRLSERMGQQFVVDNKPGGGGTIAATSVVRGPTDGYTFLYDATAHSVNPSLLGSRLTYDTERDLLPVFLAMTTPITLNASNTFEAKTVPELIALAKANPGKLNCASTGIGTIQHISLELLNHMAGVRITHVPYREAGAARGDLFSGRVPLMFGNVPGSVPYLASKAAAVMAHGGIGPLTMLPGVPAVADTLPGFETHEWNGLFAPAATPEPIIRQLNAELNAVVREPAVIERLTTLGALTRANTPEEFGAFRKQQIEFFADMVRMADIRIE